MNKLRHIPSLCIRCCHTTENCVCNNLNSIDKIISPFRYAGPAKKVILTVKNQNIRPLFDYMAVNIIEGIEPSWLSQVSGVTFVPTTAEKLRLRGFNQARELAAAIADKLCISLIEPPIKREDNSLVQHDLSLTKRQDNAIASYNLLSNEIMLRGKILLVDDVVTTGFTLDRCANLLSLRGAEQVVGVSFAATIL